MDAYIARERTLESLVEMMLVNRVVLTTQEQVNQEVVVCNWFESV
jgi:hypothetical protein